jgi:hypothetical protein
LYKLPVVEKFTIIILGFTFLLPSTKVNLFPNVENVRGRRPVRESGSPNKNPGINVTAHCGSYCVIAVHVRPIRIYRVTQKNGTSEKFKHVKHFYGNSTLLTVPLIHGY